MREMRTRLLFLGRQVWSHRFPTLRAKKAKLLVRRIMDSSPIEKMIQSVGEIDVNQTLRLFHAPNDTTPLFESRHISANQTGLTPGPNAEQATE
jgi:hypothetical protein